MAHPSEEGKEAVKGIKDEKRRNHCTVQLDRQYGVYKSMGEGQMKQTQIREIVRRFEGKYNYKYLARLGYDLNRVSIQSLDIIDNETRRH